jgi:isopentenyl-diphosphate delta-isomerase
MGASNRTRTAIRTDPIMRLTETRKLEHLNICLTESVETGSPLFEDVHLVHQALPEIDLSEIDTSCEFLGKKLDFPLMIAAMTGGHEETKRINDSLAEVAEKKGIGLGVGSQRAMIENPELAPTFSVRSVAPSVLLLGNIGITALKRLPPDRVARAVEAIEADGLCVHINPAQEIFQNEGDDDFSGCLGALETLCRSVRFPVVGKEVGNGISREAAERLKRAGVRAIDVGGLGGTNWSLIDSLRSGRDASQYREWGIPTAAAVLEAKGAGLPLIATGGLRNGLHMAKAIALGADLCGIALPFLRIVSREGVSGAERFVDGLERDFRRALFLTGCKNLEELKQTNLVLGARLKEWVEQRSLDGRRGSETPTARVNPIR